MKAVHLTSYGNPAQNLEMVEVPVPKTPHAEEALVRMEYAPIAYSDLLLANGVYFLRPDPPSVIGGEGAGIVEARRCAKPRVSKNGNNNSRIV
jgi:NADPH:quinone reductase-like Zn-dependent oxidoreductase